MCRWCTYQVIEGSSVSQRKAFHFQQTMKSKIELKRKSCKTQVIAVIFWVKKFGGKRKAPKYRRIWHRQSRQKKTFGKTSLNTELLLMQISKILAQSAVDDRQIPHYTFPQTHSPKPFDHQPKKIRSCYIKTLHLVSSSIYFFFIFHFIFMSYLLAVVRCLCSLYARQFDTFIVTLNSHPKNIKPYGLAMNKNCFTPSSLLKI